MVDQRFRSILHLFIPVKIWELTGVTWNQSNSIPSLFYSFSKVMGRFSYFSVLAYPGALGAAICASVLAERVIYSYAHGLSTIVSEELRSRYKFMMKYLTPLFSRRSKYRSTVAISTFSKFCETLALQLHWHSWHATWCCCMDCEKMNRAVSIGWFSHWNANAIITTFTKRVQSWINWRQPCVRNWNCAITNSAVTHSWWRCYSR